MRRQVVQLASFSFCFAALRPRGSDTLSSERNTAPCGRDPRTGHVQVSDRSVTVLFQRLPREAPKRVTFPVTDRYVTVLWVAIVPFHARLRAGLGGFFYDQDEIHRNDFDNGRGAGFWHPSFRPSFFRGHLF